MKKTLAVIAILIALNATAAYAKESRAHKIRRWVAAGVMFPVLIGVGIIYAPIIAPISMSNVWEELFFERQRLIDAAEDAEAKAKEGQ